MSLHIPNPLASFAMARPEFAAVCWDDKKKSARELASQASLFAAGLADQGVQPGQTVAVIGSPDATWLSAIHAVWWLGAAVAPLRLDATLIELDDAIATLQPDYIVTLQAPIAASGQRLIHLDALQGATRHHKEQHWLPEQTLARIATSGSTGRPTFVSLTAQQLIFSGFGSLIRLGHRLDDHWLHALPLNHIASLSTVFRCALNQICLELLPKFSVATVNDRLDSGDVSIVSLVPAMLDLVLTARQDRPFSDRLRVVLVGGAACSDRLLERCRTIQLPVALSWGMTETASQIATRAPGDLSPLSEGLPLLPFVRVEADEQSRLSVSGPIAGQRFYTQDAGFMTASGRVVVQGRIDDVMIRGGENIHPREIETKLLEYPKIRAAAVIPLNDSLLGQVPVAFVEAVDVIDVDGLMAWCVSTLGRNKSPTQIAVVEQLPRTPLGKIKRHELIQFAKEKLCVPALK